MFGYCVKRFLLAIPTMAAVIVVTFTLGFYGPGDPIIAIFVPAAYARSSGTDDESVRTRSPYLRPARRLRRQGCAR